MSGPQTRYPLKGIRVVELGTHVAIPSAARIMADFGAEVIKVEAPYGDGWRFPGPEFSMPAEDDENPLFTMQNANKKLLSVNIKSPAGVEVLDKLIAKADIFFTSVRMQALKKVGLDYETLHQRYPALIYCHNTGYGYQGEESWRPGFDQATFWSRTGACCDWVEAGGSPLKPSLAFGDLATGAQLLSGTLIALLGRQKDGLGTLVSTSLMGCGIWYNGNAIVSAQERYQNPYPESRSNPKNPFTGFYQASDGEWFTIVAFVAAGGFQGLLKKMFPVLRIDDWLKELEAGVFSRTNEEITARVRSEIRKKPSQAWYRILKEADITFEPCAHFKDVSKDPQAWANGYFTNVTFQNGNSAILPQIPIQFSQYDRKPVQAMGIVGADTVEILLKAGYTEQEVKDLLDSGAVVSRRSLTT